MEYRPVKLSLRLLIENEPLVNISVSQLLSKCLYFYSSMHSVQVGVITTIPSKSRNVITAIIINQFFKKEMESFNDSILLECPKTFDRYAPCVGRWSGIIGNRPLFFISAFKVVPLFIFRGLECRPTWTPCSLQTNGPAPRSIFHNFVPPIFTSVDYLERKSGPSAEDVGQTSRKSRSREA
jgi:hypothetical protein